MAGLAESGCLVLRSRIHCSELLCSFKFAHRLRAISMSTYMFIRVVHRSRRLSPAWPRQITVCRGCDLVALNCTHKHVQNIHVHVHGRVHVDNTAVLATFGHCPNEPDFRAPSQCPRGMFYTMCKNFNHTVRYQYLSTDI